MQPLKIIGLLLLGLYANIAIARQNPSPDKARRWLQTRLDQYFADSIRMEQLTTPRYARFKTDAMNVGIDGGMNQEAFEKKWSGVYDVKQATVHQGFLIPLQDWSYITVNCRFIATDQQTLWFTLGLTEMPSGDYHQRYIKLVSINGTYRIDDVLETMISED